MADIVYNKCKAGLLAGSYNFTTLPVYVALLNNSYSPDPDHVYVGQFIGTYEVSGAGYVAGGIILSSPNFNQDDTKDAGVLYGTNIVWDGGTFTARYAVLYGSSGAGYAADPLIAAFDFTTDKTVTAGTFTIQWNANGILQIT